MGILNIRPAVRAGAKLFIGIAGQSGSGKTLTALKMARGMVSHAGEIGFLDTENRRGSLYANELDGQFMIGDLFYPFTPERYSQAIKEFQAAGVKVLIIDSVSHEWESGCTEIAEVPLNKGGKMADWKKAKSEHKKFMTVALQSDMHIIACIRAAEKMDFTNAAKPVSLGIQPICEKNFMFELTVSIMMFNEGTQQQHIKVPKDLKAVFGSGNGYLGEGTGHALIEWANNGMVDPELESWRNKMQLATTEGTAALAAAWKSMPAAIATKMAPQKRSMYETAQAVDKQNEAERRGSWVEGDDASAVVTEQAAQPQLKNPIGTKSFNPAQHVEAKADPVPEPEPEQAEPSPELQPSSDEFPDMDF